MSFFLVGEGECPIRVGILLTLVVAPEVLAWDDHVYSKQDVDGIVNHCPTGNDLHVVGIKVRVEELNVSLDVGAIGR